MVIVNYLEAKESAPAHPNYRHVGLLCNDNGARSDWRGERRRRKGEQIRKRKINSEDGVKEKRDLAWTS